MKFEETGNIITVKDTSKCFIYFLLQGEEVVYVGQTMAGLSRPFSHTDKEFDSVKAIPCERYKLDDTEDYYISKYKPIYNKSRNYNVVYSLQRVKRMIREDYDLPKFSLPRLKRILKHLGITPFIDEYTNNPCVNVEQLGEILSYVEGALKNDG